MGQQFSGEVGNFNSFIGGALDITGLTGGDLENAFVNALTSGIGAISLDSRLLNTTGVVVNGVIKGLKADTVGGADNATAANAVRALLMVKSTAGSTFDVEPTDVKIGLVPQSTDSTETTVFLAITNAQDFKA